RIANAFRIEPRSPGVALPATPRILRYRGNARQNGAPGARPMCQGTTAAPWRLSANRERPGQWRYRIMNEYPDDDLTHQLDSLGDVSPTAEATHRALDRVRRGLVEKANTASTSLFTNRRYVMRILVPSAAA